MTRVVFITQQFDPAHPVLATTVPQVAAIARHVDEVIVIADRIVESALPPNARSHSFHAATKLGRGSRVIAALAREQPGLRREGGAVIAHMCPLYALLAAPITRGSRLPLVMWWVHWKIDYLVRAAERVCTAVCTVDPLTFPMPSGKLFPLGQGIDIASFPVPVRPQPAEGAPLRILVAGRYSPAKGLEWILQGVRLALDRKLELELLVHGSATTPEEKLERERLERRVLELDLGAVATLGGPVHRSELLRLLTEVDVLVNNARGGADRIAYEAAASGAAVLASNAAYASLLDPELFFRREDPAELAERLASFATLTPAERDAIGLRLRERVERLHSVESWSLGLLRAARLV